MAWYDFLIGGRRSDAGNPLATFDEVGAAIDVAQLPAVIEPRADADGMLATLVSAVHKRIDSFRNTLTGLGARGDKGAAGRPDVRRIPLSYLEQLTLYRFNAYARRFIDIWPDNATRKGWTVIDDTQDTDLMADENARLEVMPTFNEGLKWGRLFGGAVAVIVTKDDIPPEFEGMEHLWLQQPLDLDRVIAIENLVILDRSEVQPFNFDGDMRSPTFREPKLWQISPQANASIAGLAGTLIHTSRLIVFQGAKLPTSWRFTNFGFDDSELDPVYDQLRGLTSIDQAAYTMAQESNIDVLKIPGLDAVQASEQGALFNARILGMAKSKSLVNMAIIGKDDVFERRPLQLSGWKDLKDHAREAWAGATAQPQTIAFGDTPKGLNPDNTSGRRNFHDEIASYQQVVVRPLLRQFYTVVFRAKEGPTAGVEPDNWRIGFASLEELTTKDQVALEKSQAETDAIRVQTLQMPVVHILKSRYGQQGYKFDLLPIQGIDDLVITADDLAAARAERDDLAAGEGERADADEDRALLVVPLPEQAEADWLRRQAQVQAILGDDFTPTTSPHVTVLFLGEVEADEVATIASVAAQTVASVRTWPVHTSGIAAFPPGPSGIPIVLKTWGPFSELNDRLVRTLAPEISQRQFSDFRPHITLGFLSREMTAEEAAQIMQLGLNEDDEFVTWVPTTVVLRVGNTEAARFPLNVRLDRAAS